MNLSNNSKIIIIPQEEKKEKEIELDEDIQNNIINFKTKIKQEINTSKIDIKNVLHVTRIGMEIAGDIKELSGKQKKY